MAIGVNGLRRLTATKTSAYTAVNSDYRLLVDTSGGAVTITLPATPLDHKEYIVQKTTSDGNAVTVAGNGKNINGAANYSLPNQYDSVFLYYSGTEWLVE